MRYVPPWGVTDPDAPYINGDPTIGRQGSIPPAAAFEHPMRELHDLIRLSGFTPTDDNLQQISEGVRSQRLNYAEDFSTTINLITVTYDPPITLYTRGLTLRVRVRTTNEGPCSFNAGAGTRAIRKMNGADVAPRELPAGCIATLVFDGTVFQLSNFGGGGGGEGDVFVVNVPYAEDLSPTAGTIIAEFSPPITEDLRAGDLLAVKIRNTAPGPTVMRINNLDPINLAPNGGGPMLQGDLSAADVVQFFYDGENLRFAPNPEMNAPVTYSVGGGQQFDSVDQAMQILKRKTIGANGYVTLKLIQGVFTGPINISHPSGDRICIRGTMIGPPPVWNEFSAVNNSPAQRAQDAIFNINLLRTRYGTEIRCRNSQVGNEGVGLINTGPGTVLFADLLVVGDQLPTLDGFWWQTGCTSHAGFAATCLNVAAWGTQGGFINGGTLNCVDCFSVGGSYIGAYCASGFLGYSRGAILGNANQGIFLNFGTGQTIDAVIMMNGQDGIYANNNSGIQPWWSTLIGNGDGVNWYDLSANITSSIILVDPANAGTFNPPLNTIGNLGSSVTRVFAPRPPV
jgi:hypothetical protein